jgi:cytochrome c oxidase subunit I
MAISEFDRGLERTQADYNSALAGRLREIWETRSGVLGWISSVDHKEIGLRYIVTAFAFLCIGGLEALYFRLQLSWSNRALLTPERYNELFTMHGVTMILWYALPILSGFSNYLFPLLLGARDMALPRLNALSYWIYLFSGIVLYSGIFFSGVPNAGWFNYTPYASRPYNPGLNIDFYLVANIMLGVSTTVGAINFVLTTLRMRAPGMSINRVPILIWGTLTASVANIFAIPSVSLGFFMLWLDRNYGTHFFDVPAGGKTLLWQHLFWMWGHPWVYAIVLPAISMVSDALPVFCRRPLVGYPLVALATVLTMVLGFGVWLHHMFATGLPSLSLSFFSAVSILITIPSSVSIFAWLATIWTGRPQYTTAFLFFCGFIVVFVIGGVSGFMTGSVPVDWQLTDTYFVVAHIHYVLIGWNLFAVMGAIYFWFPKMTGRLLDERLGKWNFWTMFVGFNVGFFPMHILGLMGMPRRIYTYPAGMGWDVPNLIVTAGSYLFALGFLLFIVNVAVSLRKGKAAGANPWDAPTLEWSTPSPPPPFNFVVIPTIGSRHPLWEDRLRETPDHSQVGAGPALAEGRQSLASSALDAEPDLIVSMPRDTTIPLWMGIAIAAFAAAMLMRSPILLPFSIVAILALGVAWLWPRKNRSIKHG